MFVSKVHVKSVKTLKYQQIIVNLHFIELFGQTTPNCCLNYKYRKPFNIVFLQIFSKDGHNNIVLLSKFHTLFLVNSYSASKSYCITSDTVIHNIIIDS